MGLVMAERPEPDTGPRVRATISLPPDLWNGLQVEALRKGVSASALVAQFIWTYLEEGAEHQEYVARLASRWMLPKGGAARGDGDGDTP